jgi:hypothetical protein
MEPLDMDNASHLYLEELQVAETVALLDRLCRETPERRAAVLAPLYVAGRKSISVAEVYAAHRNVGPEGVRSARFGGARRSQRVAIGFN